MLGTRALKTLIARAKAHTGSQRGALLGEVIVAIAVLPLLGSAVMTSTSTSKRAAGRIEINATSQNLARNQMEIILAAAYIDPPNTYTPISAPAGYSVAADSEEFVIGDKDIAKIIVTVSKNGGTELALETLRVKE